MHQVELFKSVESDVKDLEAEVNKWLAESGVKVVGMFGNIALQTTSSETIATARGRGFGPSDVFLAVLYEKEE